MSALALALLCWAIGAVGALLLWERRLAAPVGAAGAVAGGVAAAVAAFHALGAAPATWRAPWSVPMGALALRLDPLAAVFLLPIAVAGALCAVYGVAYLTRHAHGRPLGGSFAAYDVLLASMALIVTANDLVLLLIAWELMTLSSWALVVSDHEERAVRAAGLQYLIAGHLATAALVVLVMMLATASGTFEIAALAGRTPAAGGVLFLLALIGFGTKAGIVPMHVWLPDAHPAAPSHVSALMSAVMITMGFYGLARFIPLFGAPALWWAYLLMALGAVGAVGGVAFALAQRDVKRVLAYSTVENAGITTLALGLALLGTGLGSSTLAGLAWTAALLHLWNHALAKAPLFLGFGAVAQAARSRRLDALGGLLQRWPVVGGALVLLAAAIAALPGLNVFTSEWLLLRASFAGAVVLRGANAVAVLGAIAAIVLAGAIAVACFTRLVGIALLGTPRTPEAAAAPSPGWAMRAPIALFAAACVAVAAVPGRVASALAAAVKVVAPSADVAPAIDALRPIAVVLPLIMGAVALGLALRGLAARRAPRCSGPTWGCGYPAPTPVMQYSSTSFGEPVTRLLHPLLGTRTHERLAPSGLPGEPRPVAVAWSSETADRVLAGVYEPLFRGMARLAARVRAYHQTRVSAWLLYIVVAVLVLLALLFLPVRWV